MRNFAYIYALPVYSATATGFKMVLLLEMVSRNVFMSRNNCSFVEYHHQDDRTIIIEKQCEPTSLAIKNSNVVLSELIR